MSQYPRVLPVGDAAATLELGDTIDPDLGAQVQALDQALLERSFPGFVEAVPSYRSLLVVYDPSAADFDAVAARLLSSLRPAGVSPRAATLHRLATVYGGEYGPDLEEVARSCGLSKEEVVVRHTSVEYTAAMLGFVPGFAYLGPVPRELETTRRATPRTRVPAGSVALAGRQTAVYPAATPGGWNLIGRTDARLFDPLRDPPALIQPGDRVRFEPMAALTEAEPVRRVASEPSAAVMEIEEPGLLTTVQDRGRRGYRRLGVGAAGALDISALVAANHALGNPENAAALECTVAGPRLRFLANLAFAIAGADLGAMLERSDLGFWPVPLGTRVQARAGNVLSFAGRRTGCRAYVALAGGVDVAIVLGARATDLAGGFGGFEGRALRAGDRLGVGPAPTGSRRTTSPAPPTVSSVCARVIPGPQAEHFDKAALDRLLSEEWKVGDASDRAGLRLEGPPLSHRGPAEIVSDGMLPGCIQVPPDGRPIVMLADAPTTGGYPKIATVVSADLPALGQLLPGEGRLRFEVAALREDWRRGKI